MLCSNYLRFFIDTTLFNLHSIDLQHSRMEATPMSRVLIIESSARQQDSVSRQLTQTFINQWQAAHPNDQITVRDLAVNPVPHLDANLLGGWMKPAEQRSAIEQASLDRSNELTDELLAADVLVMAAPMYNFAIPSTLKAWLDHVLRAGVTFKYTETGPQGLLTGKRAYVLTARGGIYAGGPPITRNRTCARSWASSASTT
jgi:FMN-dependent NADH-azoreductase